MKPRTGDMFGDRLFLSMKKLNVTQRELSEQTGINKDQISFFVNNRRLPSFENLRKLCICLKCPQYLLGLAEDDKEMYFLQEKAEQKKEIKDERHD
jgi:transcriptional regulator with XRE-family HTH domain